MRPSNELQASYREKSHRGAEIPSTGGPGKDQKKIRSVLKEDPFPKGKGDIKKIQGSGFWRLRIGDYRVFYDIDSEKRTVYILSIRHRSKAYREI